MVTNTYEMELLRDISTTQRGARLEMGNSLQHYLSLKMVLVQSRDDVPKERFIHNDTLVQMRIPSRQRLIIKSKRVL